MSKFILSFFLASLLLFCFSQDERGNNPGSLRKDYEMADEKYRQAEKLSSQAGDDDSLQAKADAWYREALKSFNQLVPRLEKNGNDSLFFFARIKTGFIQYYFDSLNAAKRDYLTTISLKEKLPSVADSFLFIPLLYTGGIYYTQNQFDSALFFYKKAESINERYKKPLPGSERLFNRLGVMFYENGNYRQAGNYFEKAITLTDPSDTGLLVNYKVNIASLLVKLEEYSKAQAVYESLLAYRVLPDEINHNLGIICLKQKEYKKAITCLEKVHYNGNKKNIDLYLNFSEAWAGLGENDSSEFYIERAIAENTKWNGHKKNVTFGLILNFRAGQLVNSQKYNEAIDYYQQAIMQFDAGFQEKDISKNPDDFSSVYSYINLFNTLVAKADALELLFREGQEIKFLELSFDAYRTAFRLADHVEKTYDSDEARLFLGKIKYTAHSKPIDVSLLLYDLTQQEVYLEAAYHFDQQNKASVLSLNVQQNEMKNRSSAYKELFEKEASLKAIITRLSLRSSQITDSLQLQTINSSIRDHEIELGKLQEQMNEDPAFHNRYLSGRIPGIKEVQKKLDNKTALLSWHLSDKNIVVFLVTGNRFTAYKSPIDNVFLRNIDSFKISLNNTTPDQRYMGGRASTALYNSLMAPLEPKLASIERLMIIPDDELNYLPFEALRDEKGRWLIEKFSIQYLYSTALLGIDDNTGKARGTLAFAPFTEKGFTDSTGRRFSVLPFTREETKALPGKIFTDSLAVKQNFLMDANHYGIIHLATHASVDNESPLRSFIAFYPDKKKTAEEYKLYAQEIYDLNLDSTELVILSACETGAGKLVKGEGLMSLSRAFAYAGCPNIITSLWQAEDRTTAFIIQQLHHYMEKGFSKDKALQRAKIDLLKSKEFDPRFKTPNYWAHLILIGNYEPTHKSLYWWWIAIGIIIAASVYIFINRNFFRRK